MKRKELKVLQKNYILFKEVWDKREDETGSCYNYETGREPHGFISQDNSICYHHVLPKK